MSMTMNFKKGRLIWEENLNILSSLAVEPKISFDEGITWMSLMSKAANLRNASRVTDSSIKYLGNNWKQLDVGFGFTPYSIPSIVNHTITKNETSGKAIGTYYYILRCINRDSPGLEETISNTYDATNTENNHSKVYTVSITEKSDITLYVNFAEYVSGIVLYEGYSVDGTTFPITLKLSYISNLSSSLLETLEINDNVIWLKQKFPFPKEGIVKINNEYIQYDNCEYLEHVTGDGIFNWKLTVKERGFLNTTPEKHIVSEDPYFSNVPVMLANHTAGFYGELPDKQFAKPVITDELLHQYLNFDEGKVEDIVINSETGLPNTSPTVLGQVMYDDTTVFNGYSIRLAGNGIIDTDVDTTKTMSIYMNIKIDSIQDNSEAVDTDPLHDPCIFGSNDGFWMKISRLNIKPYIGYRGTYITTIENNQMSSLAINDYHSLGVSWSKDPNSDYMRFSIYLNGKILQTVVSSILETDFESKRIYIGGFKQSETEFTNTIEAFYDDCRIYNRVLSLEDYKMIELERSRLNNIWCGKLELNENSLVDYSTTDGSNSINSYDPLFTLSYTFDTEPLLYGSGSNFSTVYDDTLLETYMTSGAIADHTTFTYPIDTNKIQVRFDLEGDGTGFTTPIIKNIALIVSEGSVS